MNTIAHAATAAALLCGVLATDASAQLAPVRVRLPGYNLPDPEAGDHAATVTDGPS
jgi:hypothetical protein